MARSKVRSAAAGGRREKAPGDLRARVLTAAVGAPLLLGAIFHGVVAFAFVVLVISILAYDEIMRMAARCGVRLVGGIVYVAGGVFSLGGAFLGEGGFIAAWTATSAVFLALALLPRNRNEPLDFVALLASWGAAMYAFGLMAFMVLLRRGAAGLDKTVLLFAAVWANDTAAYFLGPAIGGPKLAPGVSPGKTVAGLVFGVGAAFLAGLAWWGWLGRPLMQGALLGLACGLAAELGDLCESALKRAFKTKDSGALLPGHGGILDRFDGMTVAAPVMYYLSLRFGI